MLYGVLTHQWDSRHEKSISLRLCGPAHMCVRAFVCVCVCVRDRESDRNTWQTQRERKRESKEIQFLHQWECTVGDRWPSNTIRNRPSSFSACQTIHSLMAIELLRGKKPIKITIHIFSLQQSTSSLIPSNMKMYTICCALPKSNAIEWAPSWDCFQPRTSHRLLSAAVDCAVPSPVFMATEHAHVLQFSSNWPVWIVARSTQSQRMTRGDWGRVKKHLISNMFRHYRLGGVFLVQLPFAPLDVVLMYLYIVNI